MCCDVTAGGIQLDETDKQQLEILQNKVDIYLQMPETQEKMKRLGCVHIRVNGLVSDCDITWLYLGSRSCTGHCYTNARSIRLEVRVSLRHPQLHTSPMQQQTVRNPLLTLFQP